ncbi:Uracil-DNA glycosylase, family 1 [Mucinivorans hirudinis]|uniref:Uracil-DNA glycosylase n=1 Tax=Mucinivorans hirudinis TaxID=1433126 RepID=A0A060R7H5_9BACT|nr:Uracil-DNA glycosylase, family 1 [Mucinivorans hirudinis]
MRIADHWYELLRDEFDKPYFDDLINFVKEEYATQKVFPQGENIFRAFDLCPIDKLKVVILGQDPYHGEGQANGLCFSVSKGVMYPPSLQNIFREVASNGYTQRPEDGDLERWAAQGVLLLNSVLTVRAHSAASHAGRGWERFTDAVIARIAEHKKGVVYMLWGAYAQRKAAFVDASDNLVLQAVHPSPLSAYRGFLGSRHFALANEYMQEAIEW